MRGENVSVNETRWGQAQRPTIRGRLFASGEWDETSLRPNSQARILVGMKASLGLGRPSGKRLSDDGAILDIKLQRQRAARSSAILVLNFDSGLASRLFTPSENNNGTVPIWPAAAASEFGMG